MPSTGIYNQPLALLTDLYQLTMSYGYWKNGLDKKETVFQLFFRKQPFKGGFTVAAGLEMAIKFIENFKFEESDFAYLATLKDSTGHNLFTPDFFDYLRDFKFTCDIDAVPEGTIVFPYEPLLRVTGPLIQCQLLETPLLNQINFPSLIATKAARVCLAAKGDSVMEFGLRRAQGIDGGMSASRAAYIGGCSSTSNVLAGKLFNIPVAGTHSHSWVMIFEKEEEAFKAYAKAYPTNSVFLVDTFNTIEGVKKAIRIGEWLRSQGNELAGIRLDSGDLAQLSIISRKMLDDAGFKDAKIVASNELDETIINELKQQGAQISVWGVGTNLVTGKHQGALDGVYKLSAVRDPGEPWHYRLKLSEQMTKISDPGILQIRRFKTDNENIADAIYDIHSDVSNGCVIYDPLDHTREKKLGNGMESVDLLVPIMRKGQTVYKFPKLSDVRQNTQKELNQFAQGIKRFLNPHLYFAGIEKSLYEKKVELIKHIRKL